MKDNFSGDVYAGLPGLLWIHRAWWTCRAMFFMWKVVSCLGKMSEGADHKRSQYLL